MARTPMRPKVSRHAVIALLLPLPNTKRCRRTRAGPTHRCARPQHGLASLTQACPALDTISVCPTKRRVAAWQTQRRVTLRQQLLRIQAHGGEHRAGGKARFRARTAAVQGDMRQQLAVQLCVHAQHQAQFAQRFERTILGAIRQPGIGVVAVFRTTARLRERVAIAPIHDCASQAHIAPGFATHCAHQPGEQRWLGHVQIHLAALVDDADLHVGIVHLPPIAAPVRAPARLRLATAQARQRVFHAGACVFLCLAAVAQHGPLQRFHTRGQCKRADHRGEQGDQP